ncbi:MBL fold metallo-hydrolase [Acetanaerobacterium sp. MSJ-12]|uniref:MBL fold metallo-hydrolase n=1 Tax=Acetanaerobacterium sp. MSJ-12 TaxID=2841535 RepID=UPI001C0F367D|nr:MBL fold metallo-hydrolase [Acetanaerobacterium sp. MSJ-12]MBU5419750.1 MBL fold metallo-hydrolase [Acetanaerobacterium sp. MSJ-12]
MNRITPLRLPGPGEGSPPIWPVLLQREEGGRALLVDCGCAGTLPRLEEALAGAGVSLGDLQALVLTHCDHDHMGLARELTGRCPGLGVYCSAVQRPFVAGEAASPRSVAAGRPAPVDDPVPGAVALEGDAPFPGWEGLWVVDTPGHMPGHIALYCKEERTLIAGDALTAEEGRLTGPNPRYTLDMEEGMETVRFLARLDLQTVLCHHGGAVRGDIPRQLEALSRAWREGR